MTGDNAQVETKDIAARLVAEHYQAVYRYAYRLSGSATEAEDLTQQAYLIASRNLKQLRNLDKAKNWLFTILRNHFFRDRQNAERIAFVDVPVNLDHLPVESAPLPEIEPEELQEAFAGLPDAFREILGMFYFEELSYKEIAEQLSLPIGTVMSRLARAKADLRARLLESDAKGAARKQNLEPTLHPR
jgi:RNA polymerase sigma-70 factor, ECF subfamily